MERDLSLDKLTLFYLLDLCTIFEDVYSCVFVLGKGFLEKNASGMSKKCSSFRSNGTTFVSFVSFN